METILSLHTGIELTYLSEAYKSKPENASLQKIIKQINKNIHSQALYFSKDGTLSITPEDSQTLQEYQHTVQYVSI